MTRMTTALRSFAAAIALSACAGTVSADAPPPDFLAAFVFPSEAASRADEVFVLYADHCGRPHPDARRPAQITRDGQRIAVDIYLVENPAEICLAVLMPSTLVPFSLGTLPKGFYEITRRLHIRSVDGSDYRASTVSGAGIEIGDAPHPAVSGTWHDPNQPGSGLFLNLIPPAPGEPSGRAFLYLLTQRNGLAAWAGGIGQFVDGVLRVGLQGPNLAPNAGTAVFEYRGCSEALLRVEGDLGLQFPAGQVSVKQLTRTGGVSDCRPPQRGPQSGR